MGEDRRKADGTRVFDALTGKMRALFRAMRVSNLDYAACELDHDRPEYTTAGCGSVLRFDPGRAGGRCAPTAVADAAFNESGTAGAPAGGCHHRAR